MRGQRFFNASARELIAEIFDGIHFQRDHQRRSPIYEVIPGGEGASCFRARIADGETKREQITGAPGEELGPPTERLRRVGRMNPAGIGCFYAAYGFPTCIAGLRPAVGSTVVGAEFELIRPIYVLDTTRYQEPTKPLSIFAKHYMTRVEQWSFMQRFCREIAKPVIGDPLLEAIIIEAVGADIRHWAAPELAPNR